MKSLMLVIVFMLVGFATTSLEAKSKKSFCQRNRIYCKMIKLNPKVPKKWAMEWSTILHHKAKKYKINPMISVAIAMQESTLGSKLFNVSTVLSHGKCAVDPGTYVSDKGKEYCVRDKFTDIGIFQFSANTMKEYNIDFLELLLDPEYEIEWHLKILKKKMNRCKKLGKDSWSCYHSFTPKIRKRYKKLVERYL